MILMLCCTWSPSCAEIWVFRCYLHGYRGDSILDTNPPECTSTTVTVYFFCLFVCLFVCLFAWYSDGTGMFARVREQGLRARQKNKIIFKNYLPENRFKHFFGNHCFIDIEGLCGLLCCRGGWLCEREVRIFSICGRRREQTAAKKKRKKQKQQRRCLKREHTAGTSAGNRIKENNNHHNQK